MKIYGGIYPFQRFPLGWREADIDIRPRTVYVRVKGKGAVVKLKRDKWQALVDNGDVKE